ncbi:hypothetical protein LguiA_036345 [Lonicera macranthoides]
MDKIEEQIIQAECYCCDLKEDCTKDYFAKVKNSYSGKWVCGLCSEAVKETQAQGPMEEALRKHRNLCQDFNATTRLNPKLSLTWAMKDIAKRSFENRNNLNNLPISKIGRSSSCVPKIDTTKK